MCEALLLDHDGRLYPVRALFGQVPASMLLELEQADARSEQELWDCVCRRWPALAASIAAGVAPITQ